jgi:hypothetical protein
MTMLAGAGKRSEAVTLGRQAWSIATFMSASAVLVAIVLAILIGGVIGDGAAIPESHARIVLAALLIQVAVGNQYGMLDAWYRTGGRYPLGVAFRQLGRPLEATALVGAVLLGARRDVAAVVKGRRERLRALPLLACPAAIRPWVPYWLERPRGDVFRQLIRPRVAFLAFPLGNALSIQGLTIAVGTVLGPGAARRVLNDADCDASDHPGADVDQSLRLARAFALDGRRPLRGGGGNPATCRPAGPRRVRDALPRPGRLRHDRDPVVATRQRRSACRAACDPAPSASSPTPSGSR